LQITDSKPSDISNSDVLFWETVEDQDHSSTALRFVSFRFNSVYYRLINCMLYIVWFYGFLLDSFRFNSMYYGLINCILYRSWFYGILEFYKLYRESIYIWQITNYGHNNTIRSYSFTFMIMLHCGTSVNLS
jgi:hypothetical protein